MKSVLNIVINDNVHVCTVHITIIVLNMYIYYKAELPSCKLIVI